MAIRYLHKGWKLFWEAIFVIICIIIVIFLGGFIALQLDATQSTITQKIVNDFNKTHAGRLVIGDLGGTLPFNAVLKDVYLIADTDSTRADTVIAIQQVEVGVNLWQLLQKELVINHLEVTRPTVRLIAAGTGTYTLARALKTKTPDDSVSSGSFLGGFIQQVSIMAPQLVVEKGSLYVEKFFGRSKNLNLPEPFSVRSFDTEIYIELNQNRRFIDIENFSARINGFKQRNFTLSGQVFNDEEVLEFNAFNLSIGSSNLQLNGEIEGINLYADQLVKQFNAAQYDVSVSSKHIDLASFKKVVPKIPTVDEPLEFTVNVKGLLNSLKLETFKLGVGGSYFNITGRVDDLFNEAEVHYTFQIDTLHIRRDDIRKLLEEANNSVLNSLDNLKLAGFVEGTSDSLSLNVEAVSPLGQFAFTGSTQLIKPYHFLGRLTGSGVDIAPFILNDIDTTSLNFNAAIEGRTPSLTDGYFYFKGNINNSLFGHIPIDSLQLKVTLDAGLLDASYYYAWQKERIEGTVKGNFAKPQTLLTLKGHTKRLDLATFLENAPIDSTSINTTYFVDLKGLKPDSISGLARFRVEPSVMRGDSVAAHQIEVTLSPVTGGERTFAVNSSLIDLLITGDIQPTTISNLYTYWSNYFEKHITTEILLDSTKKVSNKQFTALEPIQLKGNIDFKNVDILKNYFSSFPSIYTNGQFQFQTVVSAQRFEFAAQLAADTLNINQINLKGADLNIEGRFKHDKLLKQFSNLELTANAKELTSNLFDMDSLSMNFRFNQDSLFLSQHVKQFSDTSRYDLELHSVFTDSLVTTVIDNFYLGNYQYAWTESKTPKIINTRSDEFIFDSFRFDNSGTYLVLDGRLSPSPNDTLQVKLRDIDLGRISTLLRKEFNFDGNLDGTLTASSLSDTPSVRGVINIDSLSVKNHFIGKVDITSKYDQNKDRLAARLVTYSDTSQVVNASTIPNIVLDGYYDPDAFKARQDSAFYFRANFNEIGTWFLPLILEDIFLKVQGNATGTGYIAGNGQDLNYHADMQVQNIFVKPAFINTNWHLNGQVRLDSENGVILNYIDITDESDGSGVLYGKVKLKDSTNTETNLDLHLRLDNLKGMNSAFDLDKPFYGDIAASGNINLVGPVDNLRLYTTEDLIITRYSKLGIPLITSTQVTEANEFIRFVDSFENPSQFLHQREKATDANSEVAALEEEVEDLSFSDRVNMDLSFRAPQPINVTLLFDPTTGEKVQAEGTGTMRIIMQGGDVQLFGRFNVTGGTYHFASGKIFQRKLEILPNGTIMWTGDPEDARLNIKAVYHARPEISPLQTGSNSDGFSRRVPVDLVIEITGTLNSIQQNYYFELPSFASAPPRLQYRINRYNSNEQVKLLQATSILLSGKFIPYAGGSGAQAFGEQLKDGSTIFNPIISNQIVSPFLSDQINALLNSEVAQVDIDFQLNAYNEIDLGIALRLYNDRLILQRQGRLTGTGDDRFIERLGNLSLAYRITPHLSVRAFHRQVPTLGTFSVTQVTGNQPSVEGIGVEAQVRFNTWQQFWHNIIGLLGFGEEADSVRVIKPPVNKPETEKGKEQETNKDGSE